ncbi:cytochrome P450 [Mycena vulgaris]|nr:cytochrome P450 [Mycena vulgaris]
MDPDMLAIGASVVFMLSLVIYQIGKPTPLPLIPHNELRWFPGDIPFLVRRFKEEGSIMNAFEDTAIRLGPISQVVVGLGVSSVKQSSFLQYLPDSQEMRDVLVNRATDFDRSKASWHSFGATIPQGMLALPTEEQFKRHKRYVGITMTNPYLAHLTPRVVDLMQELVDLWSIGAKRLEMGPSTDIAINAFNDLRLAALDVTGSITFGASFNGVKASLDHLEGNPLAAPSSRSEIPQTAADLKVILDTIADAASFPAPSLLPWLTRNFNHRWRKSVTNIHDDLRRRLHAARAEYEFEGKNSEKPAAHKANNVLDVMIEREREDQSKGIVALTEAEIIDELITSMLGGSETTATTMQWIVKILCKHGDVQYRLRSELLTNLLAIVTRPPTYGEISDESNLPYFSAVVYEILRCSRTASAVARDAIQDTVLLGYPIPKGTQLLMPIGMVQQIENDGSKEVTDGLDSVRSTSSKRGRKTGYWSTSDAHLFNPERWLRPDGSFNPSAGPWLPFSCGSRGCFGQKMALLELHLFLAMMQMRFFFDALPEEMNTWDSHEVVTNQPNQCYVRPILREDTEKNLL